MDLGAVSIKAEKQSDFDNEGMDIDYKTFNYVIQQQSRQLECHIKVEENSPKAIGRIFSSTTEHGSTFETSTFSEAPNGVTITQTQSRKERIWEQFKLIKEEVFQHLENSVSADPSLAFVDHLMRLLDEDAEKVKDNYKYFLDIHRKNQDIFKKTLLKSYLKCRKNFQVAFGVYVPNITQPDIKPDLLPLNSKILRSKLKLISRKCSKIITDQRNILYKSRCIAYGAAFINRNALVKEGLYWELKSKCHPSKAKYKKGTKSLCDIFQKYCFSIGDEIMRRNKKGSKKPDETLQGIISSMLNPVCIKSLVSVYSQTNFPKIMSEKTTQKESFPKVSVESSAVGKRTITQAEGDQSHISKKLKAEILSCQGVINISSSSESEEDNSPVSKSVKLEGTSTSTTVDAELKFVDNLIKYKEKDTDELKNDYMQLIEKHNTVGLSHQDSDIVDYLECREKLQIATGVYIPNAYYPGICPSDVPFLESCSELKGFTILSEMLKWATIYNAESSLHKSKCIATGLSIVQLNSDFKRIVYQKLTRANKLSHNKSLKMLSTVLETELYNIGRNSLDSRPLHEWCDDRNILSEVLSAIKNVMFLKSVTSIYYPLHNLEAELNDVVAQIPPTEKTLQTDDDINYQMKLRSSTSTQEDASLKPDSTVLKQIKSSQRKKVTENGTFVRINVTQKEAEIILKNRVLELEQKRNMSDISQIMKDKLEKSLNNVKESQSSKWTELPWQWVRNDKCIKNNYFKNQRKAKINIQMLKKHRKAKLKEGRRN